MVLLLRRFWYIPLVGIVWGVLFISGFRHYDGSKHVFILFSIASTVFLFSGLFRIISYGYLFISLLLWLGFWFKITANYFLFGYFPFGEPVGSFDRSKEAWDLVLTVATIASIGAIVGRGICGAWYRDSCDEWTWGKAPKWYCRVRKLVWVGTLSAIVIVAVVNNVYGVHLIGISPRTIFPWPINALIAWFLNIGAALLVSVLVCWDISLHRRVGLQLYAILGEAFVTTISIISRASFPLHVIAQMIAVFRKESVLRSYTYAQRFLYGLVFLCLLVGAIGAVSILRDQYYSESKSTPVSAKWNSINEDSNSVKKLPDNSLETISTSEHKTQSFRWILIHQLLINRWVGMEGLMAVSSYDKNCDTTFWRMLTEKREVGKVTEYQIVSKSGYQLQDDKYQFASMPGSIAFFYYSGSLWVVFFGMILLVVFMVSSERVILGLTLNPVFCSIYGMALANVVAQFGVAPRQDLPQFVMLYTMAIFLWLFRGGQTTKV